MPREPDKRIKCDGEAAAYCDMLESKLEPDANARSKGLVKMVLFDMAGAGGTRVVGISYKTGARDGGTFLNACPFCGQRIDQRFDAATGRVKPATDRAATGVR